MAPRKHQRKNNNAWRLPADLLLEIIACSDPGTLVRCAATCKPLRRDILHPSFIRRISQPGGIVPPHHLLAYLHTCPMRNKSRHQGPLLSPVHPATTAVSSFIDEDLAPYLLRRDISLLRRYNPVTSRGGLVVLRRRRDITKVERPSEFNPDICVYNPVTGDRTYLSDPPRLSKHCYLMKWVLLTAADGIGCSFMLLVADVRLYNKSITLQIAESSEAGGTSWGPLIINRPNRVSSGWIQDDREAVVLHGGIINWLLSHVNKILTYDIHAERLRTTKTPPTQGKHTQRILGTSSDGWLRLVIAEGFMITTWLSLSSGWTRESVIDTEHKLQSLHPYISPPTCMEIEFERSGETSGVVLLRAYRHGQHRCLGPLILLDLETKEMRRQNSYPSLLFELDLLQLLQKMKPFL
ncbi:hypothetical protein D1007_29079 [Hordeum vulgare]|nr:hypothetical protein D1007_29079 [Hordeum vulgare]